MPSRASLITGALVLCFLVAGLVGHDPWKPDEGYSFGLVLNILESGDWVVPTLAGEPFMEKPPLYYLAAAASAFLFSPVFPLHDGARIASLFFTVIAILCVGLAARRLFGAGHGQKAILLFIGCFGLIQFSHELITDTALLAGFAIATLGFCWALERPRIAGALLGTGVGVGFMSKGLVEPGIVGLTFVLLPMLFREWRKRVYLSSAAWAMAFALPWLLLWPIALYSADKALFMDWLWINNVGRYVGFAHLGADTEPWFYTRTLPWFTFPAGPIALWAIVKRWKEGGDAGKAGVQLAATLSLVIVVILATSATARPLYALPLLVPVAIIGSTVVDGISRRLVHFFLAGFTVLAASVAIAVWAIWSYGVIHGAPPAIPALLRWVPGDYRFVLVPSLAAFAALLSMAWAALWLRRSAGASWLHLWVANLVLIWGLAMTLLLPWIDEAKSFRGTFVEMARRVPPSQCVSSLGLGEPQRGMLHYVAGLKTSRVESGTLECAYVLVQTNERGKPRAPPVGSWTLVWKGGRPGEGDESFSLYAKEPPERIAEERRSLR